MEAEVQCEFCPKIRKQRLMHIHLRICRGVMECQQCRQLVGMNGGGRHAQGCRNGGYYAPRSIPAYYPATQPQAPPQWTGVQPAYNPNAGPIGPMQIGVGNQMGNAASPQAFPTRISLPSTQAGAAGMTPQELNMKHQLGGSAVPRVCHYCQTSFYGSGNDHLMDCPGVPKCPYCGMKSLDLTTHWQNECTQAYPQQATDPAYNPPQQSTAQNADPTAAQPNSTTPSFSTCTLCSQILEATQVTKQLQCGHICHLTCIGQAFTQKSLCPLDQTPVS